MARYLKAQLIVLLFGGLVGPIFLIVYFSLGYGSLLQWMFYVGLVITAADVAIALALANFGAKSSAKNAALEQNGVLTLATITGVTETGTWINNQQVIKVRLHISGPGLLPFDSEDRVVASVTRLGNLNARKVVVLVNPTSGEYRIDWERSALVNGLVPAQFSVAEDNRTYDLSGQAGPLLEILQILKANNVPLDRMVDIRNNPALRAQIQAVVRRAAQPQAQPAQAGQPGAVVTPPPASVAQRLDDLKALHAGGTLTDDEYQTRRAQIISEI